LNAFRDLFDARAESLLKNAIAENNYDALERIVDGMFLASCGDKAADIMADFAFEEGRLDEALFYWDMILNSYPDTDISKEFIYYKILCVLNYLGKKDRYQAVLNEIKNRFADKLVYIRDIPCKLDEGVRIIEESLSSLTQTAVTQLNWPVWGGNNSHNIIPDSAVNKVERLWSLKLNPLSSSEPNNAKPAQYPCYYPIIVDGKIYVNSGSSLRAIDIKSAKLKGVFPPIFEEKGLQLNDSSENRGFNTVFSCTFNNGRIYLNMIEPKNSDARYGHNRYPGIAYLACINASNFKVIWDSRMIEDEFLKDISIFSPALVFNGNVISAAVKNKGMEIQIYLCCLNGDNGNLLWNRFICSKIRDTREFSVSVPMPTIAESNGVVYCLTNSDILAAISAGDGGVAWLVNYADDIAVLKGKAVNISSYPIVFDGVVYVTPADNPRIYGFSVQDGKLIKVSGRGLPIGENICMIGLTGDSLLLANNNSEVFSFTLKNSKIKDSIKINEDKIIGRGFVTKDYFYIPALKNILKFDIRNKELVDEINWSEAEDAGNIIIFSNYILSVSAQRLSLYGTK
jgi:outer membrane protein assembly factor BamB